MYELIHESYMPLQDGKIIRLQSYRVGSSKSTRLIFGFYRIEWSGVCDPEKDGYKKSLFGLYRKIKKMEESKTKMKASEVIERLKELIDEHGDLEVGMQNSEYCMIDTINRLIVQKRNDTDGSMYNDPKELGDTYIVIDN